MFETFVAIGIIMSLIYYEFTHLSPGGLITPGYLALFIDQPLRILATLTIALVTFLLVKVLKKYLPIYGRRQFALAIVIAIFIRLFCNEVLVLEELSIAFNSIGVIIPGLIASDMLKQTIAKTLYSTAFVTAIMFAVLILLNGRFI